MRPPDWPKRLSEFIEAARERPFVWGHWDCVQMTAAWVELCTGTRPETFARRYRSRAGAARLIRRKGGLINAASGVLGPPLPGPLLAQRGDIVAVDTIDGPALGICIGAVVARPDETGGLRFDPLRFAECAWRVG